MRLFSIDVTHEDPDLATDRCWSAGAAGIWETDGGRWRVGVDDGDAESFVAAVTDLSPVDVTDTEVVALPTRDVNVAGVDLMVPATVFGDGGHPTTAGCLSALAAAVSAGARVLDVGCGTGVLAIAAARAGADVTALDVDPEAVSATRHNAAVNGVDVAASTTPLADVEGTFDVVVANVVIGGLRPLLGDLVRVTGRGGRLIVSGMLDEQWTDVEATLRSLLLDRPMDVSATGDDGWVTAVIRTS